MTSMFEFDLYSCKLVSWMLPFSTSPSIGFEYSRSLPLLSMIRRWLSYSTSSRVDPLLLAKNLRCLYFRLLSSFLTLAVFRSNRMALFVFIKTISLFTFNIVSNCSLGSTLNSCPSRSNLPLAKTYSQAILYKETNIALQIDSCETSFSSLISFEVV